MKLKSILRNLTAGFFILSALSLYAQDNVASLRAPNKLDGTWDQPFDTNLNQPSGASGGNPSSGFDVGDALKAFVALSLLTPDPTAPWAGAVYEGMILGGTGWSFWPGRWNEQGWDSPMAEFELDSTNNLIICRFKAGGGDGFRGDRIHFFISSPDAQFEVNVSASFGAIKIPMSNSYDSLSEARAGATAMLAKCIQAVKDIIKTDVTIEGFTQVRATKWELIAVTGTAVASIGGVGTQHDGGQHDQFYAGAIPFDFTKYPGRQIAMERWDYQRTSGDDNRLQLQSLEPLDILGVQDQLINSTTVASQSGFQLTIHCDQLKKIQYAEHASTEGSDPSITEGGDIKY
jgi:hypothetical protein